MPSPENGSTEKADRVEAGTQKEREEFRDSGLEAAGDERSKQAQQAEAQRAATARRVLGLNQ
ncbi:hypothetical protein KA119_00875 [Candidatus Gracilibacteria bacterium]|nr:hypothetical protein [Candidatus Gracilibacteria bacterium]